MDIFSRQFTQADVDQFAHLSGDLNPLHTDPVVARRLLFGGTVCHGVALTLWVVDCLATRISRSFRFRSLTATFRSPVMVGDKVKLELICADDGQVKGAIFGPRGLCASLSLQWESDTTGQVMELPGPGALECRSRTFSELSSASGAVPVSVSLDKLCAFSPAAARWGHIAQLGVLLATTRLVGMECPGLHSVYHSLKLQYFSTSDADTLLNYRVTNANERYARLTLSIEGCGCRGELLTSVRPAPYEQPAFAAIRKQVAPDAFRDERALVIGGSRGLGELAAKILLAGGAAVRLSFYHGKADAMRLNNEVRTEEPEADLQVFPLDVTDEQAVVVAKVADFRPTQLYFFASPKILLDGGQTFDTARYDLYFRFYVTSMCRLIRNVSMVAATPFRVFLPSTSFIDAPPAGAAEYIAAKVAAEEALLDLAKEVGVYPVIHRLPPLASDQTASLGAGAQADGFEAVAGAVYAMRNMVV